jgi:hypothetical protein
MRSAQAVMMTMALRRREPQAKNQFATALLFWPYKDSICFLRTGVAVTLHMGKPKDLPVFVSCM